MHSLYTVPTRKKLLVQVHSFVTVAKNHSSVLCVHVKKGAEPKTYGSTWGSEGKKKATILLKRHSTLETGHIFNQIGIWKAFFLPFTPQWLKLIYSVLIIISV